MSKKTTILMLIGLVMVGSASSAMATPVSVTVPDGGSSALMLSLAAVGLGIIRRFKR